MQRKFLDWRDLQVRFQGIHENRYSSGRFHGPLSLPARSCARRLVCSLKPSSGMRTRTGPLAALSRLPISRAQFLELLGIGPHEQVLRVVPKEFAVPVPLGHLAHPEIGVVDRSRHDHLRQAGRACAGQSRIARGINAVDDQIGEFVRRHIDDAGELARRCQPFERLAADARGVKQDDLVAQGFQAARLTRSTQAAVPPNDDTATSGA